MGSCLTKPSDRGSRQCEAGLLDLLDIVEAGPAALIAGHADHFIADPGQAADVMKAFCGLLRRADPATVVALSDAFADEALS